MKELENMCLQVLVEQKKSCVCLKTLLVNIQGAYKAIEKMNKNVSLVSFKM